MYTHELEDQVSRLIQDGLLKKDQRKDALISLKKHWDKKIAIVWDIRDVRIAAKSIDVVLSEDQSLEILGEIFDDQDEVCSLVSDKMCEIIRQM